MVGGGGEFDDEVNEKQKEETGVLESEDWARVLDKSMASSSSLLLLELKFLAPQITPK